MSDVLFVFVSEDSAAAETLADMYETIGFSLDARAPQKAGCDYGASIIIWSEAAAQSPALLAAAHEVQKAGKAVVASFAKTPPPPTLTAPAFDLSAWTGLPTDPTLDRLLGAVERRVMAGRIAAFVDGISSAAAEPEVQHEIEATPEGVLLLEEALPPFAAAAETPQGKPPAFTKQLAAEPLEAIRPALRRPPKIAAPRPKRSSAARRSAGAARPFPRRANRIAEYACLALFFCSLGVAATLQFAPKPAPRPVYAAIDPDIDLNPPSALSVAHFQAAPRETALLVRASYSPGLGGGFLPE